MTITCKPMVRGHSEPIKPITEGVPKWLGSDNFVFRHRFPPPYPHAPHPRQMSVPYSHTAKLRNFPWLLYWETSAQFRLGLFFGLGSTLAIVWKVWYALKFSPDGKKNWNGLHETNVTHAKHSAYAKQLEADHSIFGWTHGEQFEKH